MKKYFAFYTLLTSLCALLTLANVPLASAVSASEWRAGNIISDTLFYDSNSMSVDDIQAFLNAKNPTCDTWGTQPATEKGYPNLTHAQYAEKAGWSAPPYICLKDYYQVPRSDTIINNFNSTATRPDGSISAAQIIKNAAVNYGVSPKALLVLLQKESPGPLPIDSWPLQQQYKNAMGYACPDTAPCDPQYAGFYNQVTNAAKRIQTYKQYPTSYRHQPFTTNSQVYYNPDLSGCGWSPVYIEGYATAGLYNYTPYQPNQAALNNLYGTGDGCSAYGNRNFWRIWNDWFGSSQPSYLNITPEWFEISSDISKVNPFTNQAADTSVLKARAEIRLLSKISTQYGTFYRTEYDTSHNLDKAIPESALTKVQYTALPPNTLIRLTQDAYKQNPYTGYNIDQVIKAGTELKVTSQITVAGVLSYRTEYDTTNSLIKSIPAVFVQKVEYTPFEEPRWLQATKDTAFYDPFSGTQGATIVAGQQYKMSSKVDVSNTSYARTVQDTMSGSLQAIRADTLGAIPYSQVYPTPLLVNLTATTKKLSPSKETTYSDTLSAGGSVYVSSMTVVNGTAYVRSQYDTDLKLDKAFPIDNLRVGAYSLMSEPRKLKTIKAINKVDPLTGKVYEQLPARSELYYTTKYSTSTETYLRSEYDSVHNLQKAIPMSSLSAL